MYMKWKIGIKEDKGIWDINNFNNSQPTFTLPQNTGKMGAVIYTGIFLTKQDSISIIKGDTFVGCSGTAYYKDVFGHYDSLIICEYFFSEKKRFINCEANAQNKNKWGIKY